jgi:serine phosphatase RsbU (regulator of sigma subunit)/pSer/pThr/pTyr-binding forkhead associated (FHA) protein
MASLTVLKGVNQGTVLPLEGEKIILGRNADCQVVINVPAVSREHAQIRRIQGKFYIEDLKSRNGTFVNNQEVTARVLLKDNDRVKICDNVYVFAEADAKPPLPADLRRGGGAEAVEEEESSSTVEATLSHSSKRILEAQPAEKLAFLLEITGELTQTFALNQLLPKIVDSLFHVFRQADRGFIILTEEGMDRLIPTVVRTRRPHEESSARFSQRIVRRCLETGEGLLSEDATADKRFDLSQSIADARIRSVMCAPLLGRSSGRAFGVIQLDTQDRSKKFNAEDLKLLMAVAGQAAIALENARMHETLVARAGLERDLSLANKVQLSFLPKRPPQVAGYEFFAHYEPAQEVGGDYYDFIPMPNQKIAVMIGDVAGKGVPAALLMAKVSSDARFTMLTERNAADAVSRLNELMQEAGLLDRFVTLSAAVLDPLTHEVTFVNAGHLPPLLFRATTGKFVEGAPRDLAGFPLGVADGIPYEASTVQLSPGDAIVLCTDGVTEAKDKQDHEFNTERTIAALQASPCTPRAMGPRLVSAVKQHAAGCKQHDDITVVSFGRME